MPITSPFDVVNRRRAQTSGSAFPASGYVPEDQTPLAPTSFEQQLSDADKDGQQLVAKQQKQAQVDAANAAKAQVAQTKNDQAMAAAQAKADATTAKTEGIVTQPKVIPGPSGKPVTVAAYQQNPDGTTAYQPTDMGIKPDSTGQPYRVRRDQWGREQWTSPTDVDNSKRTVTPTGQVVAKPLGKGSASLPATDVSSDPSQTPQVDAALDQREQKLVSGAAKTEVATTVGAAADQATNDFRDAQQAHQDSLATLRAAKVNQLTDPDSYQRASDAEASARKMMVAAAQKNNDLQRQAKDAKADPLGYLERQKAGADQSPVPTTQPDSLSGGAQPAPESAQAVSPPPSAVAPPETIQPPHTNASTQTQPSTQNPDNVSPDATSTSQGQTPSPATGMAAPSSSAVPTPDATTDPNVVASSAPIGTKGPTDETKPAADETAPKLVEIHPMSATQDFINNFDRDFSTQSNQAITGAVHLNEAIQNSWLNPGHWIDVATKALTGYDPAATRAANLKVFDSVMAKGREDAKTIYPVDESRENNLSRKASNLTANVLPMLAAGPARAGMLATNIFMGLSGGESTREEVKARGGSDAAADAAGSTTGVIYGLAGKLFGPFSNTFQKLVPGASKGVARTILNFIIGGGVKSAQGAVEMGTMNAASSAATNLALDASGAPKKDDAGNDNRRDIIGDTIDGLTQGALFRALLHPTEFAAQEYNNMKVGDALKKQGAAASFVQATAKAYQGVDLAQATGSITPQKAQQAKDSLLHFLTPENRTHVQAHVDNVNTAQNQAATITQDSASAIRALGKPAADLAHMSDEQLQSEHADVTDRAQQVRQPDAPDPTVRQGLPQATPEYQAKVSNELQRRAQVSQIQQDAQAKLGGVADHLSDATVATQQLVRKPGGYATLRQLNDYNAKLPVGTPKADAITARTATEIAPPLPSGDSAPLAPHYFPVAHQIEQLTNPDQQTMATAALKLVNGRALNSQEQALMVGDPATKTPPAVDDTTGKPLVSVGDGGPVLTDAGLNRLKTLVPAAADVLPGSEQAQREFQAVVSQKSEKTAHKGKNEQSAEHNVVAPAVPHPDLAHLDDETLNTRIGNMTAAMEKTRASGGKLPPSAQAELARYQGESNRRFHAAVPAKEGDTISYVHDDAGAGPQRRTGEVVEVKPDGYRVVDTSDGSERTVPFSHALPRETNESQPKAEKPGDVAGQPKAGGGESHAEVDRAKSTHAGEREPGSKSQPPPLPKAKTGELSPDLDKLDPATLKAHPEAAALLSHSIEENTDLLQRLGLTLKPSSLGAQTFGLAIVPGDPNSILVDVAALQHSLDVLKKDGISEAGRRARVQSVIEEEVRHAVGERVADDMAKEQGTDKERVWGNIWDSLNEQQKAYVLDAYGSALVRQSDANKAREYVRMLGQLEEAGHITEVADLLSQPSKSFLQKVLDYLSDLKKSLTQKSDLVNDMASRIEKMLKGVPRGTLEAPPKQLTFDETLGSPLFEKNPLAPEGISELSKSSHENSTADDQAPASPGNGDQNADALPEATGSGASSGDGGRQPESAETVRRGGTGGGEAPGGEQVSADSGSRGADEGASPANSDVAPGRTGGNADAPGTASGAGDEQSVSRKLPPVDSSSRVNRDAATRAVDAIVGDRLFPKESARFVNQDGGRVEITKAPNDKFRVSYWDSGSNKPWKATTHASLDAAVKAVTGRGYYYHGKADDKLVKRLSSMPATEVALAVRNEAEVSEDQLHVALASLTDQGKTEQASAVERELRARESIREEDKNRQEAIEDAHESLGPSMAEKVSALGGLPKPGTPMADGALAGGEYQRLYDAWRYLKSKPDKNWYEQRLAKLKLFTDKPKWRAGEIFDQHLPGAGFEGAYQAVEALTHELESGNPHYPAHLTSGEESVHSAGVHPANSPGYEAARNYLLAHDRASMVDRAFDAAHAWMESALEKGRELYETSGLKAKGQWLAGMAEKFEKWAQGAPEPKVRATIFDYLSHGGGKTQTERDRFTDDLLAHFKSTAKPSSNPARLRDGRITRPIESVERERVNRLIAQARDMGQRRFSFVDNNGATAQVYTAHDGTTSIRLASDAGVGGSFKDVRSAVAHLVDKGFEFQSASLEKKLARKETINRFTSMVMGGLKLGQNRFHFQHEDGSTAALIARKDGTFSVAGMSKLQKFSSAAAATTFLHDHGYEMQSSKLERDLRAKGLHPDQANESIPYTDQQKAVINQYQAAKGEEPIASAPVSYYSRDHDRQGNPRSAEEIARSAREGDPHAGSSLLRGSFSSDPGKLSDYTTRSDQARAYLKVAAQNGKILPRSFLDGMRPIGVGGEHEVYLKNNRVYKITQDHGDFDYGTGAGFDYQTTPHQYLERFAIANHVFGGDIKWEGIIPIDGHLRTVTSQDFYKGRPPEQDSLNSYLKEMGFHPSDAAAVETGNESRFWYRPQDGILLADAKPANFVNTASGDILPIDVIAEKATRQQISKWHLDGPYSERPQPDSPDGYWGQQGHGGAILDVDYPQHGEVEDKPYREAPDQDSPDGYWGEGGDGTSSTAQETREIAQREASSKASGGDVRSIGAAPVDHPDMFDQRPEEEIATARASTAYSNYEEWQRARPIPDHSLLSPNGSISQRSRDAANARFQQRMREWESLRPKDANEDLEKANQAIQDQIAQNQRRIDDLRGMAERGMKPKAFRAEADRLEAENQKLTEQANRSLSPRVVGGAEIKLPSKEAAMKVYRRLAQIRQEKGALNPDQSRLMEAAEKTLGQDINDGGEGEKPASTAKTPPPKVKFGQPDTGIKHELEATPQDMFGEKPLGQQTLFSAPAHETVETPDMFSKREALRTIRRLSALQQEGVKLDDAQTKQLAEAKSRLGDFANDRPESEKSLKDLQRERLANERTETPPTAPPAQSTEARATPEAKEVASKALGFTQRAIDKLPQDVHKMAKLLHEAKDDVIKWWAPQIRSEPAARTGRILSANLAEIARNRDHAEAALHEARGFFDQQTPEYNRGVIAAIENNTAHPDPKVQEMVATMRTINNQRRDIVRSMPNSHFKNFIEHYFPHIWAKGDLEAARRFYQRKIEGSRAFLKHRSIPTVEEGIQAGLHLVSDNPVDLFLIRWNQMDKYVAGQRMLQDMQDAGLAVKFEGDSSAPEGWRRIDDRIGLSTEEVPVEKEVSVPHIVHDDDTLSGLEHPGKMILKKEKKTVMETRLKRYYAPDHAVTILENHLSPGLQDFGVYKAVTGVANTLNQAQLGLSAFHLGFTTMDAATSKLSVAITHAVRGDGADVIKRLTEYPAQFISPLQMLAGYIATKAGKPEWDTHIGSKLLREWYKPGSQGEEMGKLANALIQGGGRTQMDPMYSNQMVKAFTKQWRQGNIFAAAWRAPLAAVEIATRPIMEYIVPRQKLSVFADMARREMKRLGPTATQDDVRRAMQRVWASVDNRMGQLAYDNLHWNKFAKDTAMIATRSVGWNLGSFREILGGLADYGKAGVKLATMNRKEAEFTDRMSYILALTLQTAFAGAIIQYLYTGEYPKELRDYFFPKTGEVGPDGHNVRLALPTYMKDVYAFSHEPGQTLVNKANPIVSMMGDLWNNKDFFGTEIRHTGDNPLEQGAQALGFVAKNFLPFSVTGAMRLHQQGASTTKLALPFFGVTPAAAWIDKSAAEIKAQEIAAAHRPAAARTQEATDKMEAKGELMKALHDTDPLHASDETDRAKRSAKMGELLRQAVASHVISPKDVAQTIRSMRMSPLERHFRGMDIDDATDVWNLATPEQKKLLAPMMTEKLNRAVDSGKIDRADAQKRLAEVPHA